MFVLLIKTHWLHTILFISDVQMALLSQSKLYLKSVAPSALDWQLHYATPELESNTDLVNII